MIKMMTLTCKAKFQIAVVVGDHSKRLFHQQCCILDSSSNVGSLVVY